MMKILLTAEFDKSSLKELEDLFEITYAGWFVYERVLAEDKRKSISQWLLQQQYQQEHFYSHAAAGGWSWTDLPGGVPD
ncbi:MAG: hypothetical protein MUO60_10425, partial [Clostridiaceae bacterium]|nr:hypothetical protein [Clostridiaceae bacterium]